MRNLVIVPTYNEKEGIADFVQAVLAIKEPVDILVVDDNSPDGTGLIVAEIAQKNQRVHLLTRKAKDGLGRAYLAGFQWALDKGYEICVQMDADFSHRPIDLNRMLQCQAQADLLIGSRYVIGGGTQNWGIIRKMISRGGSFYSRLVLGFPVNDWTGGFNLWHAHVLKKMELEKVQSNGYCFQIEMKFRAICKKFSYQEFPILFEERRVGQSKMSLRIVLEAIYKVWKIRFGT